jgi:hypothetical protein
MTSDENVTPEDGGATGSGAEDTGPKDTGAGSRNDLIEVAIGLAVLGLGAAVLNGGRGGIGGIVRTVTQGPTQRTPPIGPAHLRRVDPTMWRNPPVV